MNNLKIKRINKELKECQNNNFKINLIDDDITKWILFFDGPSDTPYENFNFKLSIIFPIDYPFSPPDIRFLSKIFHPNISLDSIICLDILKYNWSPVLSMYKVIISLISLLSDPNTKSPLNDHAAKLYNSDIDLYNKTIIEFLSDD